jgi:hypothetical protein
MVESDRGDTKTMTINSNKSRFTYMFTKAQGAILALTVTLGGVGCGATMQTAAPSTPSTPAKIETVVLADGVELKVSEDAGPEARRVVDQIRSEMRSRYIGAR